MKKVSDVKEEKQKVYIRQYNEVYICQPTKSATNQFQEEVQMRIHFNAK